MNRFVIVALLLMAWAYWELSGGADFAPEQREVAVATQEAAPPVEGTPEPASEPEPEPQPAPEPEPQPNFWTDTLPPASEAVEELQIEATLEEAEAETPSSEAPAFEQNPLTAQPEVEPEPALEAASEAAPLPEGRALHVVIGSRVNLREGPGTSFATIGQVTSGMILDVLEFRDDWAYVEMQTGDQGWISASFLTPLDG